MLKAAQRPDAIFLFTGYATPASRRALAENPRTVPASTSEPAFELKLARAWSPVRRIWAWRLQGQVDPFLYRPARPDQMQSVVFASEAWKEKPLSRG